jgi:hypothetical protein
MRTVTSGVVAILLGTLVVVAQTPPQKPGPEHKRLERMVGRWTYEGEVKASPLGPAGKVSSSETCELFPGGFAVTCRMKGTGPKGPMTGMNVMSYSTDQKAYTYHAISSLGDNIFVTGNVKGNVWTFEDTFQAEGTTMKVRATVTEESPTVSVFKLEVGPGDGKMMVVEEGRSTKQK